VLRWCVSVSLAKSEMALDQPNQLTVRCPRCDHTYRLGYSDDEWNRLKDWLGRAERALREEHKHRHELLSLPLAWSPVRGR
jgi:hypothetical protein